MKSFISKIKFAILLVALCSPAASWAEFKSSVGLGLQFGGVIGWQGALQSENHKLYLSVGAPGISIGYGFLPHNKVSVGVNSFATLLALGYGTFLNFHFRGHQRSGFLVGFDLFQAALFDSDDLDEIRYSISLGYTF